MLFCKFVRMIAVKRAKTGRNGDGKERGRVDAVLMSEKARRREWINGLHDAREVAILSLGLSTFLGRPLVLAAGVILETQELSARRWMFGQHSITTIG